MFNTFPHEIWIFIKVSSDKNALISWLEVHDKIYDLDPFFHLVGLSNNKAYGN